MLLIFCFIYVGKWYAYHLDVDRAESNTRPCCLTFREVFQSTNTWEGKFGAVSRWSEWILVFRAYSIKHLLCIFWNIIVVYGVNSFDQLKLLVSFENIFKNKMNKWINFHEQWIQTSVTRKMTSISNVIHSLFNYKMFVIFEKGLAMKWSIWD